MKGTVHMLILTAAILGQGCSGLRVDRAMKVSNADWIMEGGSVSRINITVGRLQPPLRAVWQYSAQAGLKGSPLVCDSVVIVGTLNGELQAVNLANGKRIGYKAMGAPIAGTPVLDGSTVYLALAGKDQTLLSFDLNLGKRLWEFQAGPVETSPLLIGDELYVASVEGAVYCVEKNSGKLVWKYEIEQEGAGKQIHSSPASDGTLIAFGSDDGTLTVLDRKRGALVWKDKVGGGIFGTVVFSHGLLVVGTLDGTLGAYEAASGALRWKFDTHAAIYGGASAGNGMVYVGSSNGFLYCLEEATGKEQWRFKAQSVIDSAPLVAGDRVAFGALDRTLYVLSSSDGRELWRFTADGRIRVTPVLWGDILLVTSEDKYVTALRPEPL